MRGLSQSRAELLFAPDEEQTDIGQSDKSQVDEDRPSEDQVNESQLNEDQLNDEVQVGEKQTGPGNESEYEGPEGTGEDSDTAVSHLLRLFISTPFS